MTEFTVAAIQFEPQIGDPARNLENSCRWIEAAASAEAKLVVLPEASSAGYVFRDRAEAAAYAEPVPTGPTCRAWADLARRYQLWIVGGLTESENNEVFNSAVLIGPQGHVGTYRKAHLWNNEKEVYSQNQEGFPVFETELGRIGIGICYDAWFPETFRSAALQGADILVLPSNWVPVPGQPTSYASMANLMCMTGAHSNQLFVAGVSRVGLERGQRFIGGSVIIGPDGWPLAGPASSREEEILFSRVDLVSSRAQRRANPFNQPLRDRRTDLYHSSLVIR